MALIVEQHVVADMYPVGSKAISAGMTIALDSDGNAAPGTTANKAKIIGIAGDSALSAEGQTTALSASVVIGAVSDVDSPNTRYTSNRVTDFYDETAASGKVTVYNGGGKFWISEDLVTSISTCAPGDNLISDDGGMFEESSAIGTETGVIVATVAGPYKLYPSGVPGVDTDGSISIANGGTNNYWLPIVLRV